MRGQVCRRRCPNAHHGCLCAASVKMVTNSVHRWECAPGLGTILEEEILNRLRHCIPAVPVRVPRRLAVMVQRTQSFTWCASVVRFTAHIFACTARDASGDLSIDMPFMISSGYESTIDLSRWLQQFASLCKAPHMAFAKNCGQQRSAGSARTRPLKSSTRFMWDTALLKNVRFVFIPALSVNVLYDHPALQCKAVSSGEPLTSKAKKLGYNSSIPQLCATNVHQKLRRNRARQNADIHGRSTVNSACTVFCQLPQLVIN